MAKTELGRKHECSNCSARFYDLRRTPAACPKCGTEVSRDKRPPVRRPPVAAAAAVEEGGSFAEDAADGDEDADAAVGGPEG